MPNRIMKMMDVRTSEKDGQRRIEGYFAVFDKPYQVYSGWVETIAPGAFTRTLERGEDVKILWNHNADIVLGSTAAGTATLRQDDKGLFGVVLINEDDTDALNAYARISRGDVDGCSFGFQISSQTESWDDDGTYRTVINEVDPLYEVSPCTFPAYPDTSISARNKEALEDARAKVDQAKKETRKSEMLKKLKGE